MRSAPSRKLSTLCDVITQSHPHRRAEARAISAIINDKFVLHLIMFEDLFRTTKFMSDQLQAPNFDLIAAEDLAQSVLNALSGKRTDTKWKEIQQQATNTGTTHTSREKRQTQKTRRLWRPR